MTLDLVTQEDEPDSAVTVAPAEPSTSKGVAKAKPRGSRELAQLQKDKDWHYRMDVPALVPETPESLPLLNEALEKAVAEHRINWVAAIATKIQKIKNPQGFTTDFGEAAQTALAQWGAGTSAAEGSGVPALGTVTQTETTGRAQTSLGTEIDYAPARQQAVPICLCCRSTETAKPRWPLGCGRHGVCVTNKNRTAVTRCLLKLHFAAYLAAVGGYRPFQLELPDIVSLPYRNMLTNLPTWLV